MKPIFNHSNKDTRKSFLDGGKELECLDRRGARVLRGESNRPVNVFCASFRHIYIFSEYYYVLSF